jgi:hypothetical protein
MVVGILIVIAGYIVSLLVGVPVVSAVLKGLNMSMTGGIPKAGRYIGILERFIVFSFVLINQYAVIGLVFAAKSIARFEALKDRKFAEYYLLGTLASISWALLWGLVTRLILRNA